MLSIHKEGTLSKREHLITRYMYFSSLFNTVGWLAVAFIVGVMTEERCLWNNNSNFIYSLSFPFIIYGLMLNLRLEKRRIIQLTSAYLALVFLLPLGFSLSLDVVLEDFFIANFFLTSLVLGVYLITTIKVLDFSTVLIFMMAVDCMMQGYYQLLYCDFDTQDCSAWYEFREYYGVFLLVMWSSFIYNYGIRRIFK
jgi:hypothetical protein